MAYLRDASMHLRTAVFAALLLLSACANQENVPASERGFFGGIAAASSGADVRRASNLEQEATERERKSREMAQRAASAERDAQNTSAQVRTAEQRLNALRSDLQRQKDRLAQLRAAQASSGPGAAEANRIQSELNEIEQQRAAIQSSGGSVTPAALNGLEQRAREVDRALNRLGSA